MAFGRYRIDPIIDKEFRRLARAAHGDDFIKGHYMEEANKAFAMYNASKRNQNTHAHAHNSGLKVGTNVPPKVSKFRDNIVAYLENNIGYEGLSLDPRAIPFQHFKQAVAFVRGTDDRTFDKGRDELKNNHLIKEYEHGVEFVVEGKTLPNVKKLKQKQIDDEVNSAFKY